MDEFSCFNNLFSTVSPSLMYMLCVISQFVVHLLMSLYVHLWETLSFPDSWFAYDDHCDSCNYCESTHTKVDVDTELVLRGTEGSLTVQIGKYVTMSVDFW